MAGRLLSPSRRRRRRRPSVARRPPAALHNHPRRDPKKCPDGWIPLVVAENKLGNEAVLERLKEVGDYPTSVMNYGRCGLQRGAASRWCFFFAAGENWIAGGGAVARC